MTETVKATVMTEEELSDLIFENIAGVSCSYSWNGVMRWEGLLEFYA